MVSADKYLGTGRINHTGVGNLIQVSDTYGFSLWVGYVGDDHLYGMGPGVLQE